MRKSLTYFKNHKSVVIIALTLIFVVAGSLYWISKTNERFTQVPFSEPITYNSNCNLPTKGSSKAEIRAKMTALYACPVQSHLEKYKDKTVTLENGKTQTELLNLLFKQNKLENNKLIYDSGKWQIYFWSQNKALNPKTENFEIHSNVTIGTQNDTYKLMNRNMAATSKPSEEVILNQPEIIIATEDRYEALNYKHILNLTGFETEQQMLDFVLIENKLLGQNYKQWRKDTDNKVDAEIANYIPLLFLQDYQFTNKDNEGLKFGCDQDYQANLKTEINLNKKEIVYFAHLNQNSLSKVKLWLENGELKYEIKTELSCGEMINC